MSTLSLLNIIDWIDELALYITPDYEIVAMNAAAASFFACDQSTSIGKNALQVCSENKQAIPTDEMKKVWETGHTMTVKMREVYWQLLPAEQAPNQKIMLLGKFQESIQQQEDMIFFIKQVKEITGQDVKENLRLPLYANMIKHYYERLIDHMPHNVYWLDRNCVTLGCNQNVLRLIGLTKKEQFVGITYEEMGKLAHWTQGQAESFKHDDMEVMRTNQLKHNVEEPILYDENNEPIYYLSSRVPLHDDKGEVIGVVGISIDVTDLKKAEELKKKNIIAEQVIQRLKAISAGLSYEVRSSMAAVRLGFERTRQFFSKLTPLVKQLHARSESQQHGAVTIEELTDYQQLLTKMVQRIDSSVALMDMQLKNMVTDRIEKHLFHHHQIKDSVQQAVDTFPLDDASLLNKIHIDIKHCFKILGDKLLTKHVLWNLLNNALYFMREEGRGEIFITTEEMIEYHLLRFKDTAKGIRASKVTQIFEPFYTSRKEGHGLGLHFCQLVMQSYGGKIECWAKEGESVEFLLSFPKTNKLGSVDICCAPAA